MEQTSTAPMTIEERNAWFAGLSPREQRIQLAKDVLEQLDTGVLDTGWGYLTAVQPQPEGTLQQVLQSTVVCEVCARGALFYARVAGYNEYDADLSSIFAREGERLTMLDEKPTRVALDGVFTARQLYLIETAFERYSGIDPVGVAGGLMYLDLNRRERLRAVMQNIIDHDGVFVVPGFEAECREMARVKGEA